MKPIRWGYLFLLVATTASAQTVPVYSWNACVDLVQKNNADLRAANSTLESIEQQEGVARSGFLPTINANLSYTRSNSTTNIEGSDPTNLSPSIYNSNYSAALTGSWNLFAGLQDIGKVRQAYANTDAQRAALQISKAQISYDLRVAYQGFLYSKEYLKLTKEIIRRREENLRLVELRFQSGLENKGSVLLSKANADQARYDDIQASNAQRVARAQLARALGFDEFTEFDVEGEIPVRTEPGNARPDLKDLALQTPDVKQATAKEEAAYQGMSVSRATFFPALNLTGSLGKQGPDFFPNQRDSWSVGLNLSLPLFNGGKDYYNLQSTSASWAASSSAHVNTNRQVLAKLEQTYSAYIEGIAKLKVDQSFRDASTVRAEISRKRYNNGLITFDDWNIIEDDLINRQKSYLQSKRDRVVTEAAYDQARGLGVIP